MDTFRSNLERATHTKRLSTRGKDSLLNTSKGSQPPVRNITGTPSTSTAYFALPSRHFEPTDTRSTAGVLLLTILFIEYGGWFMLRVVRGRQPTTAFQKAFFRAGHAHAGVLVTLALVCLLLAVRRA